jgi:PAS domain S-box-containing protein
MKRSQAAALTRSTEEERLHAEIRELKAQLTAEQDTTAKLKRREAELADFLDNSELPIHWVGPSGEILWANEAELKLLGYSRDEYIGHHISEFHADGQTIRDILERLTRNEALHGYEARLRAKDGTIRYVLITSNVRWDEGAFVHTRCLTSDITDRKRSHARLAAEHAVSQLLNTTTTIEDAARKIVEVVCKHLDFAVGAFWAQDSSGQLRCLSLWDDSDAKLRPFVEVTRARHFLPGTGMPGRVWTSSKPVWIQDVATDSNFPRGDVAARAGLSTGVAFPICRGETVLGVLEFFSRDPRRADAQLLNTLATIGHQAGQFLQRHRAEQNLARRLAELELLYEMAQAVNEATSADHIYNRALDALARAIEVHRASILVLDQDRVMRFVAWRGISDEYRAAVEGHSPWSPDDAAPPAVLVDDVGKTPELKAYAAVFAAENIRALAFIPLVAAGRLLGKFMLYYEEEHEFGSYEIALARTIANYIGVAVQRQQAAAALQDKETRLRLALEASNIGVWEWDIAANRVIWSDRVYQIHGLEPGSISGKPEELRQLFHPDESDRVSDAVLGALASKTSYALEFRIIRPTGEVRWIATTGRVICNSEGQPVRLLGTTLDITDRKTAEDTLAAQAAELARSNADLQQFAYVTSHDLQEPLRNVRSYAQLLGRRYEAQLDADGKEFLKFIVSGATHMHMLIEDLLSFSKLVNADAAPFTAVDMNAAFAVAQKNLHLAIAEASAQITATNLPMVEGDEVQLVQVLQNLISNSIKYRREDPRIQVFADRDVDTWTFGVRDNGIGIAPEYHERIFGVFKRLHGKEIPGTGIGLAICKKIIEKHGGRMWVESTRGVGSTFYFTVPAASSHVDA